MSFSALDIYDGIRPSGGHAITDQVLLIRFTGVSVSLPVTTGLEGVTTVIMDWGSETAVENGTATWFRCHQGDPSDGFQMALDGSVGTTEDEDIAFNDVEFVAGQTYALNSFTLTMADGNADVDFDNLRLLVHETIPPLVASAVFIRLYDGIKPDSPSTAVTTQNLLIQAALTDVGNHTQMTVTPSLASGTGDATWFRIVNGAGEASIDGTVGIYDPFDIDTSDNADILLDSVSFVTGEQYDLGTLFFVVPYPGLTF
jgi:hypothetical protein